MMDAIQVWDVDETVAKMRHRVAPTEVVTGEHCHNKVMFKQFLWPRPSTTARSMRPAPVGSTRSSWWGRPL